VFAMLTGHLNELIGDRLLGVSICRFVAQPYDGRQLPPRNQLDLSPHLDLPKYFQSSGSIFDEATTHPSVAETVSQCGREFQLSLITDRSPRSERIVRKIESPFLVGGCVLTQRSTLPDAVLALLPPQG
jgi:hypothetical protein